MTTVRELRMQRRGRGEPGRMRRAGVEPAVWMRRTGAEESAKESDAASPTDDLAGRPVLYRERRRARGIHARAGAPRVVARVQHDAGRHG